MGMSPPRRPKPRIHDQAWHYLLGLGPDLAFLQEALPPTWVRSEGAVIQGPFRDWGSVIFSPRFPVERVHLPEDSPLRSLGSYLAFAVASLPDGSDAFVASVHAVAKEATRAHLGELNPAAISRPSRRRPMINDLVFATLEEVVRGRRFIAAGDWNISRLVDRAQPGTGGAEFFERVNERGWFECVWKKHGKELQTFFRPSNPPYQNDHIFCDPALGEAATDVWVAPEAALTLGLSDHAPLIVDFDIPPISITSFERT
jgi:endonuclease/exonuclease/phosphatase (EEP) superfamily protein YafD